MAQIASFHALHPFILPRYWYSKFNNCTRKVSYINGLSILYRLYNCTKFFSDFEQNTNISFPIKKSFVLLVLVQKDQKPLLHAAHGVITRAT